MHDGSLKTLEEVVEFYDKGGLPNKNLDEKITKLNLTDAQKKDLVEFLKALDGTSLKVGRPPPSRCSAPRDIDSTGLGGASSLHLGSTARVTSGFGVIPKNQIEGSQVTF